MFVHCCESSTFNTANDKMYTPVALEYPTTVTSSPRSAPVSFLPSRVSFAVRSSHRILFRLLYTSLLVSHWFRTLPPVQSKSCKCHWQLAADLLRRALQVSSEVMEDFLYKITEPDRARRFINVIQRKTDRLPFHKKTSSSAHLHWSQTKALVSGAQKSLT